MSGPPLPLIGPRGAANPPPPPVQYPQLPFLPLSPGGVVGVFSWVLAAVSAAPNVLLTEVPPGAVGSSVACPPLPQCPPAFPLGNQGRRNPDLGEQAATGLECLVPAHSVLSHSVRARSFPPPASLPRGERGRDEGGTRQGRVRLHSRSPRFPSGVFAAQLCSEEVGRLALALRDLPRVRGQARGICVSPSQSQKA